MVFSNVGGDGCAAICSTSCRLSAIALSRAPLKSCALKLPNGGTPPQGPAHGDSQGFAPALEVSIFAAPCSLGLADGVAQAPSKRVSPSCAASRWSTAFVIFRLLKRGAHSTQTVTQGPSGSKAF